MNQRQCMPPSDEEFEQLLQAIGLSKEPRNIDIMVQYVHCFPVFPVIPYVAVQIFGMTPEEVRQLLLGNDDNSEE